MTIIEGIKVLKSQAKDLKKHIFTAYNQWEAKCQCEMALAPGTLMLVDDYQQNLTVELSSTPTPTPVYGANQVNTMIFPIVVYYKESEAECTKKSTITFVSDDLHHDHQQVLKMEKRAVDIVGERTGLKFSKIIRFSDGCGAQFKSRFCVTDLCSLPEVILGNVNGTASFHYFESHEGKSESDTAGSNFKVRVQSMILKNTNLVITCARDLVAEYLKCAPNHTKCYEFCVVEEFPSFVREKSHVRAEVKIPSIRKIHSIVFTNGGLKCSNLSCITCLKIQEECDNCSQKVFTVSPKKLEKCLGRKEEKEEKEEGEQSSEVCDVHEDIDILEKSDEEYGCDNELDEGEDDVEVMIGDIVWGLRYGYQAPAKVIIL